MQCEVCEWMPLLNESYMRTVNFPTPRAWRCVLGRQLVTGARENHQYCKRRCMRWPTHMPRVKQKTPFQATRGVTSIVLRVAGDTDDG